MTRASPTGAELVTAVALVFYLGSLVGVMASNTADVAKAVYEKVDPSKNKEADGDEDLDTPSKKLTCYHRIYDWAPKNKTLQITCDSKKDKCAYVYVHYYNNEKKKINLLSQHCNHFLTPQRRQDHCKRMKVYVKDAGHTPYAACEFDECDKDLCNVPFEHGFRPALVVLISLSCAATTVALLGCICCCISCCKSGDDAGKTTAKEEGGDQTNENYGKGYNQNSSNVDENNNDNNNNNNDDGNDGDVINIEINTSNQNNNNNDDDDDDGVNNLMNEVIQAVVETEEPSGLEVKAHLICIESDEEIGAEEKRRPASASSSFAMGLA